MTAVPDAGFVFAGWTASSGGSYSSATISFTMPQNADAGGVVLTAHFKADAHEHNYAEIENTRVNPTCTTNGSAKYTCTICGEIIEKELPALGHDWDGGVRSGDTIVYTCKREGCGEVKTEKIQATPTPSPQPTVTPTAAPTPVPTAVPTAVPTTVPTPTPHEHSFQLESDTATCTEAGVKTLKCNCGETATQESPALGHDAVQQPDGSVICSRCHAVLQAAPPSNPTPVPDSGSGDSGSGDNSGETSNTNPVSEPIEGE